MLLMIAFVSFDVEQMFDVSALDVEQLIVLGVDEQLIVACNTVEFVAYVVERNSSWAKISGKFV